MRVGRLVDGRLEGTRTLASSEHRSLAAALAHYLDGLPRGERPRWAALAVASPVSGDRVRLTNRAWSFSRSELEAALEVERLAVVNDFTALALALPGLSGDQLRRVRSGEAAAGAPLALLGPGTGLGMSGLIPVGKELVPVAGEGGHRDLAATTPREWEVYRHLRRRFGRVSAERAVSGPGLVDLYTALSEIDGAVAGEVEPAGVVERAAGSADPRAAEALRLFAGWLGALAGDLVLTLGARGGVVLGGGVLPKMGPAFDLAAFEERFLDKGRFRPYLEPVPVDLVVDPAAALLGAARALA